MASKILVAVCLFVASISYGSSVIVYVQKTYPEPQGSCASVDCQESIHEVGLHTFDCYTNYTVNNQVVTGVFYLRRIGAATSNHYDVVTEQGAVTGKTAHLKKTDTITVYKEFNDDADKTIKQILCATDERNPTASTKAKLNKQCKFPGMKNNDNTNC